MLTSLFPLSVFSVPLRFIIKYMALSRRNFLILTGVSATGIVLAAPLQRLYARVREGKSLSGKGFGPLVRDTQGLFDLPEGFQYRALSKTGEMMNDTHPVPAAHDGMGAFSGESGTTILVRNHELNGAKNSAVMASSAVKYDPLSKGGTTTLIIGADRQLIDHRVSLAGTSRNCGGGTTPWGSWISCEEDITTTGMNKPGNPLNVSKKHGYNFEVSHKGGARGEPVPLIAMGRFNHEAIAVDPQTGIVYQTEDREDSCFYRFIPKEYGKLQSGGVLEALVIKGRSKVNTSLNFPVGEPHGVEWVPIEEVDPDKDTLRYEAQSKGAAVFKRGEGICFGNGEIYFVCTSGGKAGKGQVFRYNPGQNTLELYVESPGAGVLDYPDNIVVAPFGDLIMCEDGAGEQQFLVGVNPQGELYKLGRNALNTSELAGVCFAPDGKTMFVNIQKPGITLAIWGPWGS